VRDAVHLRSVILDDLTSRQEVSHVETHLIFENVRKPFLEPLGRDD
jgi:hypothetical protein